MYESTINFTLDTICPWFPNLSIKLVPQLNLERTYLAKRRLDAALRLIAQDPETVNNTLDRLGPYQIPEGKSNPLSIEEIQALYAPNHLPVTDSSGKVKFTIKYLPFRLNADTPAEGVDKADWYKRSAYGNTDEKWKTYMMIMTNHGNEVGIDYDFGGITANTLNAHRVLQYFQTAKGTEAADKLVTSLYRMYFEERKHPSSRETVLTACKEAGIDEAEAEKVVGNEDEGLKQVKDLLRCQVSDGIDAVPHVVVEGKRMDITLSGAKQVKEYVKTLREIIKQA